MFLYLAKRQRLHNHIVQKENMKNKQFCEDVVDHMSKWTIWQDVEPFELTPEIFCDENNVDSFFSRVRYMLDKYTVSCFCKAQTDLNILQPNEN